MQSVQQLNRSITTTNNLLARFLFRTGDGIRWSSQYGVANSKAQFSLSFLTLRCPQSIAFKTRHYESTIATTTKATTVARRTFGSTPKRTNNLSSSSPPPSPSLSKKKKKTGKAKGRNNIYWSLEENTKMLELMRDNIRPSKMAPHFPQVTVNALRKHVASIRQRLGALSTTVSDLHDEKVIMNVANRLLHQQRWSKEQSDLLQVVYDKHGSNWDLVATLVSERGKEGQQELFPTRTTDECRNRIESSSLGYNRGPWSIEELERFWKAFKEVEADNKHKSRALKSKARGVGRMDKVDIGNLGAVDDGGGKDTRFVSGFWQLVADKVQTRNRTQCCRVYNNLISGRATETGKGRERKPWTVEELEALRDLKAGQSKSWEYGETNGNKSSAKMLTDEQREEALKFLMQTRNSDTVYWKALYVQKHAKACSMTVPDYLDGMIDKKRRLGHAENLAKERKQLIAAKMNSKIIGKKGR